MKRVAVAVTLLLLSSLIVACSRPGPAANTTKNSVSPDVTRNSAPPAAPANTPNATGNQSANTGQVKVKSPLPPPTGFVNDYAKVIDKKTKKNLEAMLGKLKERSGIEFAVVMVDTTGGQDIYDYSLAVARGWGIGPENSDEGGGILLMAAIKDRKWYIQVSRSLENDLPDGVVGESGRLMIEPFRRRSYGEGVKNCVRAIIARLTERRKFSVK